MHYGYPNVDVMVSKSAEQNGQQAQSLKILQMPRISIIIVFGRSLVPGFLGFVFQYYDSSGEFGGNKQVG